MSAKRTLALGLIATLVIAAWGPGRVESAPTTAPDVVPLPAGSQAKADKTLAGGVKFLLAAQQEDGSWGGQYGPAITALAVKTLYQAGQPIDSPPVQRAVQFILSKQKKADGKLKGAFADQALANYNTAICLSTLVLLNHHLPGKPYDEPIKAGLDFLRRDQWDESEGIDRKNPAFGGWGYGTGERPDMSNLNTTMDAVKALEQAGYLAKDDPMYAKVQVFLQRAQNRSESNDAGTFAVGDDGGLIYTPALSPTKGGAESKAGSVKLPDGRSGLRSYGMPTYAGFKSYVYSGLTMDDPRVKAAYGWIRANYTLNENPGIGADGLFYYYHTFARALRASGQAHIRDQANVAHDWRAELIDKLAGIQRGDGSWVNEKADRWEEGNPVLATCFAMLALEEAVAAGR